MVKQFKYNIQAEGRAKKTVQLSAQDIHTNWNVFHKNPDSKGLWVVTPEGYLQITSNQDGLSGRFNEADLHATDYGFRTELIPSSVDDDSFGIHFRYQDNFHFYFVAWDGGGEYGWGTNTLRLYKVSGDTYELLATTEEMGLWVGGQKYVFDIEVIGNYITIGINGAQRLAYEDTNNPYLRGAYGPCATSQVTTWTGLFYDGMTDFLVTKTLDQSLTIENYNYANGKKLSEEPLEMIMYAPVMNYLEESGYAKETAALKRYTISTMEDSVEVYFYPASPTKISLDGSESPYGYLKYEEKPPSPPSKLSGVADVSSIKWTWDDTSNYEDGYQFLDAYDNVLATLSKNITTWTEYDLDMNTSYTRRVRAYNKFGASEYVEATAVTQNVIVVSSPNPPSNLFGTTVSTTQITWRWDYVEGADSYELYDKDGTLILKTSGNKFDETGLEPDKMYERYVVAKNIAGGSGPSEVVLAFTDAVKIVGKTPGNPQSLTGEAVSYDTIVWTWTPPDVYVNPYQEDGVTPKTLEEIAAEREELLADIAYRVYDQNGEVLYESSPAVYEFHERHLSPDKSYTHFVRAFNVNGEGPRSNYAYVRTPPFMEFVEEEEEQSPWPLEIACTPADQEPDEKLTAFHSGVGDNLDLKVRTDHKGTPQELFSYDLQLKGIERFPIKVYPPQPLRFRFRAEGEEQVVLTTAEYAAELIAFPEKQYSYRVDGAVELAESFSYKAFAEGNIMQTQQVPIDYTWQPYADIAYKEVTMVTTASMFQNESTKGVYGPNTWTYDSATDTVRGNLNTGWSGAYNKEHMNFDDYAFEAEMGVINGGSDNDVMGIAFRINKDSAGNTRMYYFVSDRADSSGQAIGSVWKLGKTKRQESNSWDWPFLGTEVAATTVPGWVNNQWYHIRVQVSGPRIMIWLDDVLVIDVVDDDPDLVKGAFGPTNSSQVGASFRKFEMNTVITDTVYGDAGTDSITDVNNSSNKKALTTETIETILAPKIQERYESFKTANSAPDAVLDIQKYVVKDSRSDVVTEIENDNGVIYAYTDVVTSKVVRHDVVLESEAFSDSITDAYNSEATSKELLQTVGGQLKAHTVMEIMKPVIDKYKADNGIPDGDATIDKYSTKAYSNGIFLNASADGASTIKAHTTLGTSYSGSKTYQGVVYEYEGWKSSSEPASVVPLYNKHGQAYTGVASKVTYELTNLKDDYSVTPVWVSSGVAGTRTGSDTHRVRTTDKLFRLLDGVIDGGNPRYFYVHDLIALPDHPEYDRVHYSIRKTGVHENVFLYFKSEPNNKSFGAEVFSKQRDEILVISAEERDLVKTWNSYSEWYEGQVNGESVYKKEGDGKNDLRVPIEVNVPEGVKISKWYVEMEDPQGTINFVIENGVNNYTTMKNDIVIFYSNRMGTELAELEWYGPKISGETVYQVVADETLKIQDRFLSPYRDPLLSTKNIDEWRLIITSKNPNVRMWEAEEQKPWDETSLFLDVNLMARLINPTQTSWTPLVHNGFYYFNQREYFLYSDTKVKGRYIQSNEFQEVEFSYTIKAHCERITGAGMQRWTDTNRSNFGGVANGTDLDSSLGDILLAKNLDGTYYEEGTYVSEDKSFNGDTVEQWGSIDWLADTPKGSSVKVETSSVENGIWTPWAPAENGQVISSPLSSQFKYRVTLFAGSERASKDFSHETQTTGQFNTGQHTNSVARTGFLRMLDTEKEVGSWMSQVFDLGEQVESLGSIHYMPLMSNTVGEKVEIYTVSSDSPDGPWDGTGEPLVPLSNMTVYPDETKSGKIASVKKRYVRYQARFTRGREDAILTNLLKGSTVFSQGKIDNIIVRDNALELSDMSKPGTYVSHYMDMGHVTSFQNIALDAVIPNNGEVSIATIATDDPATFPTLEATESNWKPLNADKTIASSPARFLKVRATLKAGKTEETLWQILHSTKAAFSGSIMSNIEISDIGELYLKEPRYNGYYESAAMDFTTLKSWETLNSIVALNGGNTRILTQTSSSALGPWSAWQELGLENSIASPINNFLRYRVEMTGFEGTAASTYHDDTLAKFQDDVILSNAAFISDTQVSHEEPSLPMRFTSGVKLLADATELLKLMTQQELSHDASVKIYTKTSSDNVNWTSWLELGPAGEVMSPHQQYLRYFIDVTQGYGAQGQKILAHNAVDFQNGVLEGMHTQVTSNGEQGLVLTANETGTFYSPVFDFYGLVTGWDAIRLAYQMPDSEGTISVFTATSDSPTDISHGQTSQEISWTEATYDEVSGEFSINSLPARYLAYRIQLSPGFGPVESAAWTEASGADWSTKSSMTNIDYSTDVLTLTDPALTGEYISEEKDFHATYPRWISADGFSLDVVGATTGGSVELLVKTAATLEELSTAPEVSLGTVQDGTLAGSFAEPINAFMVYILRLTAGTAADESAMAPKVTSVAFTSSVRYTESPEVTYVEVRTQLTGHRTFVPSVIGNVSIDYIYKVFSTPVLTSVETSGIVYASLTPAVSAVKINADVYYWRTPQLDWARINSTLYEVVSHTPIIREISYGAKLPSQVVPEEYGVSMMGRVAADSQTHRVSEQPMKAIIDNYLIESGVDQSNLVRNRYSLISAVPGIFVETKDSNASIHYEDGLSEVFAYTTDTATENIYSQAKVIVDENNEALVTPVPQQGAPIIVRDKSGKELRHVTFLDDQGALTLTNTEEIEANGLHNFTVEYANIDLATFQIWVDERHNNQYTEIKDFSVCNNEVTTREVYPIGTPIRVKYKLLNSFYVDYNYDVKEGYAMIKMHKPVLDKARDISVRFETSQETAYYNASEINLNPMQNLMNEGFLYLTDEVRPARQLEVRFNPNVLQANGYDRTTIVAIARDEYGNPVVGDMINFFASAGTLAINQAVTDINGMAIATYTAPKASTDAVLTVIDRTSRIETTKSIYLRKPVAKPRITVSTSKSSILPDNKDIVIVTARVAGETQEAAVGVTVLFETLEGTLLDTADNTNYIGEAYARVKTDRLPSDDIMTIKVRVPDFDLEAYVNVRVKEVTQLV